MNTLNYSEASDWDWDVTWGDQGDRKQKPHGPEGLPTPLHLPVMEPSSVAFFTTTFQLGGWVSGNMGEMGVCWV